MQKNTAHLWCEHDTDVALVNSITTTQDKIKMRKYTDKHTKTQEHTHTSSGNASNGQPNVIERELCVIAIFKGD